MTRPTAASAAPSPTSAGSRMQSSAPRGGRLLALLAAVALVLFVACANVANLQLMRMEGRRGELAVHAALGAGRARLVRQVALEMLMLAAAATAIGAALAWWGVRGLVAALPAGLPRVGGSAWTRASPPSPPSCPG